MDKKIKKKMGQEDLYQKLKKIPKKWRTSKEIAEIMGWTRNRTANLLRKLYLTGDVFRIGNKDHKWGFLEYSYKLK